MKTNYLKPCPFCGGTDVEISPWTNRVYCESCRASTIFGNMYERTEIIRAWNQRAGDKHGTREEIICDSCIHDRWHTPKICRRCVRQEDGTPSMYESKEGADNV